MQDQVEQWLESFLCSEFTGVFRNFGLRTLQSVCHLQANHLQLMCIPQKSWPVILHNVQLLRQSLGGCQELPSSYNQQGPCDNLMHVNQGIEHPNRSMQHQRNTDTDASYHDEAASMMSSQSPYRLCQQQNINSGFPQQGFSYSALTPGPGGQQFNMGSMAATGNSQYRFPGQVPGSPTRSLSSVRNPHPHLRSSVQNPQDVANNILHMANSSYPTNHNVQIPLSQARSGHYNVQQPSSQYGSMQQQQQDSCRQMTGDSGQFTYANTSPHMAGREFGMSLHMQREVGMSPVSPAPGGMMHSPHSQRSSHSVTGASPCSMHSPGMGNVQSPIPDMVQDQWRMSMQTHQQTMDSMQQGMFGHHTPNHGQHRAQQGHDVVPSPPTQGQYRAHQGHNMVPSPTTQGQHRTQQGHDMVPSPPTQGQLRAHQRHEVIPSPPTQGQYRAHQGHNMVPSPTTQGQHRTQQGHNMVPSPTTQGQQRAHQGLNMIASPPSHQLQVSVSSPSQPVQCYSRDVVNQFGVGYGQYPSSQYSSSQSQAHMQFSPSAVHSPASQRSNPSPYSQHCSPVYNIPYQNCTNNSPTPNKPACMSSKQLTQELSQKPAPKPASNPDGPLQSLQRFCQMPEKHVKQAKKSGKSKTQTAGKASPSKSPSGAYLTFDKPSGIQTTMPEHEASNMDTLSDNKALDHFNTSQDNPENIFKETPESMKTTSSSKSAICQGVEASPSKKRKLEDSEMCCQPKKMILMRVAKDDLEQSKWNSDPGHNPETRYECNSEQAVDNHSIPLHNTNTDTRNDTFAADSEHNISDCQTDKEQNGSEKDTNVIYENEHSTEGDTEQEASDQSLGRIDDIVCGTKSEEIDSFKGHSEMEMNETSACTQLNVSKDSELVTETSKCTGQNSDADVNKSDLPSQLVDEGEEVFQTEKENDNMVPFSNYGKSEANEVTCDEVQSKLNNSAETFSETHDSISILNICEKTEAKLAVGLESNRALSNKMNTVRSSVRLRVGSAGSLSESPNTSEYEYDQLGCDDVETIDDGFCELDQDCVVNGGKSKDISDNDNVDIVDSVVISNWQPKSKFSAKGRRRAFSRDKENVTSLCFTNRRKTRSLNRFTVDHSMCDSDQDSLGYTSPYGDMVDGPVGLDNGNGTVTMVSSGRSRPRKMPVKYKDTSFFQGDFVFIEEEEEYLTTAKPKNKAVKNITLPTDMNHNAKKNGHLKTSTSKKKANSKRQSSKHSGESSSRSNSPSKSRNNSPAKSRNSSPPKSSHVNDSVKVLTKETNNVSNLKKQKKKLSLEVSDDEKNSSDKEKNKETKPEVVKTSKSSPETKRACVKDSVKTRKLAKKEQNELEKAHNHPAKPARETKTQDINGVRPSLSPAVIKPCEDSDNDKKADKNLVKEEVMKYEEVIEIDSDSSDGNVDKKVAINDITVKDVIDLDSDDSKSETQESCEFKFTLVEESVTDLHPNILEFEGEDVKMSSKNCDKKIREDSKVIEMKKSEDYENKAKCVKNKQPKVKRKYTKKKSNTFEDDDPDFETGPKKQNFKSIKAHDVESKKRREKKDKWANFKGPKIVVEGSKETPDKCFVINDPFDEIDSKGSKRSKVVAQNVTRIEISHLPSDKSVLTPNSDNLDSENWACALCGKHSSYKFLGDLFGPYTVETMSTDLLELSPKVTLGNVKKRKSDDSQASTSKSIRSGRRSGSVARETSEWKEVWVHESCAVYSDGVFLIGPKIYGLQEAVRISSQTPCSKCNEEGAMIGCLNKGCQQKFHHACAQDSDCYLDEENFSLLCPKHKIKKLKQLESSTSGIG
ncbi:uncharacterized protein LOC128208043 isoform X2 [Mya arenaria]|uniref:uncharacterized protein LOC128208043 isoform X2 n=1 Tax=Mya arenaria TaxID=6604 RepID=UPI0022E2D8FA|nr:uncharacterized protein LOC128208043 isoform X2 [Mya arenaria]